MIIREVKKDLLTVNTSKYVLAHCISADCAMGSGIAKQFRSKFYEIVSRCLSENPKVGDAIRLVYGNTKVYNLVTKSEYWQKPTYKSLTKSLMELRKKMLTNNEHFLAVPTIGAGLDKLKWIKVREIIISVFKDTDIEILVCIWK